LSCQYLFMLFGSVSIKAVHRTLMKLSPGVNFINIFTRSFYARSSKRKKSIKLSVSIYAFGIYMRKSCTKNVDEIEHCCAQLSEWKLGGCYTFVYWRKSCFNNRIKLKWSVIWWSDLTSCEKLFSSNFIENEWYTTNLWMYQVSLNYY